MQVRWPVALAVTLVTWHAWAHDYWLLPDRLRARTGSRVTLSLWVGDDFVPEAARPWQRARTTRFERLSSRAPETLLERPREGAQPLLDVALGSGGNLFVMDRDAARLELPAERFERYLHEEGLDAVIDARRARGESSAPGRERYTRALKAFVQVGAARDGVSMRVAGQVFELVPAADLARARRGQRLAVSVRFRGLPLAGVTVEALSRVGESVQRAREVSDAHGEVTFTLDREATWLLRATHMARCEGCPDADWESWWTSYTFGLCAPGAVTCTTAPMTVRAP
jgi:Domain of unknown function (DUF4198)